MRPSLQRNHPGYSTTVVRQQHSFRRTNPNNHRRYDMPTTSETVPHAPTRPIGMTASSGVAEISAAAQLRGTDMASANTLGLTPVAIQRWEAEGGALGISHG